MKHREPLLGQGNINIREFLQHLLSHFHFPFLSQHQVIISQLDTSQSHLKGDHNRKHVSETINCHKHHMIMNNITQISH